MNFPAVLAGEASTGFATSTGGSLANNLVRIGAFDTDPSSLVAGVATLTTPSAVLSNLHSRFTQYTSFTFSDDYLNPAIAIFPATDADGIPLEAQPGIGTSLQGKDIYLLFYNAATANAATEVAIFRMKQELLLNDPSGSTGVFSTGTGGDGQRTATFNLSVVETDLMLGFYNSTTDTFLTADLNGGAARIVSVLAQTNTAGSAVSYQILANNGADRFFATTNTSTNDLTVTTLPTGFSISTNTGIISVATNAAAGTYPIRLVASNSLTASVATNTLTWVVQASTFTTTTNLISATAGVEISPFTFASTGVAPTYSVASGNLRGLTLSTNGVLSGIPTSVGTNDVTIEASDAGQSATTTFSLAVTAPTIAVPGGDLTVGQLVVTAGTARTSTVTKTANFTNLTGTVSPVTTGVSFDGNSLIIATNAQPLAKGTTNVTLTLTASRDVGGTAVSAQTTVPLRIVAPVPTALVGTNEFEVDINQPFAARILTDAGGFARMSFSNLPSGLVGDLNGNIQGTNFFNFYNTNQPNVFVVPVRADSMTDYEGGGVFTSSVSMRLRNTNLPIFSLPPGSIKGRVAQPFSTNLTASISNFPFLVTGTNLPPGLQLTGTSISGTPTTAGTFSVPVTAYNSYRPGSTNPADWQTNTATLVFEIAAQNRGSFAFDGNLNNTIGTNYLNGSNLVYAADRRGVSGRAVRSTSGQGLFRTNPISDLSSQSTMAFWFKMPETPIPEEGWWLFSSGSFGVRLLPDPGGAKVEIQGVRSMYGPEVTNAVATIGSWVPGSGWHHLCVRSARNEYHEGLRVFYDGAEIVPPRSYHYLVDMDLNNLFLGANPTSSLGTAFPGEFDDFVIYDELLGIYEPLEASYPENDHYANPTISELYLGLPSLRENHAFFGFDVYGTPWPDQYNIEPHGYPYNAVEFESLFGLVALQDNGDLSLIDSFIGGTFRYDPSDLTLSGAEYSRKTCDPRMLYGNAQAVSGPAHLIVLKKNGDVVEQKWGTENYYNEIGNVATRHTGCIAVAAGFNVGMALGTDGLVRVWHPFPGGTEGLPLILFPPGRPLEFGQTNVPTAATNCVAIAAGEEHCLALTAEGRVVAWGGNDLGQTSVPVAALTGVVKIAAGPYSSIALKKDGTIITWGDGRTESQNPPAEWQGHFQDIVARSGMMGGVTDLGRPILWRHGSEGEVTDDDGSLILRISDGFVGALRVKLPNHVSRVHMGYLHPYFRGHLISYEAKTAVPFWKVQIPKKVAVPEQSSLRLDLRTFLTTSAIPNLRFEAIGLPEGSSLDSATGTLVISNSPASARAVQILARNDQGLDRWTFSLQSGGQGLGLQPLPAIEWTVPIKLAELMVPTGWSSPTPMDPSRYEVKVVGDRMEIWSVGGLDYENPVDRSLMITISALDLSGVVQTASSPIILGNNSSEDQDQDGLLEIYEQYHGSSDGNTDSDGDGFSDLLEVQQRTSPSQAAAFPGAGLASVLSANSGSSFGFQILAPMGKTLYLESSSDLVQWAQESFPDGSVFLQGDGKVHQVQKPLQGAKKFYRTWSFDLEDQLPPQ